MLLSIIIPIYNGENYIKRCLESIIKAKKSFDLEVLLINDGSTDSSSNICEVYKIKYNFINVFNKQNGGVSSARNLGIENAKGKYITFVDIDDFVGENYFENLFKNIDENIGLLFGGFIKVDIHNNIIEKVQWENIIINTNNFKDIFENYKIYNFGFPVSKLFNSKVILENNIRFPEDIKMFEDSIFLMKYVKKIDKIKFIDSVDYNYLLVEGSLSNRLHEYNSEFNAFLELYNISTDEYKLTKDDLLEVYPSLGFRISALLNKAIVVLYRKNYNNEFKLNALKSIPTEAWDLYKLFYRPTSIIKKVFKTLLVNKKFIISNKLMTLIYKMIK